MLVGCGDKNQMKLKIQLLKGSIPGQIVNQFHDRLQQQVELKFTPIEQLRYLFQQLQNWQKQPINSDDQGWKDYIPDVPFIYKKKIARANLVTLGDYWLKAAIEQKLIQPLAIEKLKNWSALDKKWQQLVTRDDQGNVNSQGKVWGAPYRWGNTVIVYDREKLQKLGWEPKDWGDLWRNELRQRISIINQPREVIGLVLKKLGQSYNTENLEQVSGLEQELKTFNQQVKLYDSQTYLEPLIVGDTWLAVGWSSDISQILSRYPQFNVIIPQSGTAIWADLWVSPASVSQDNLTYQWVDFCWLPDIAKQISLLTKINSPISTNIVAADIQKPLQNLLLTNREAFDQSEFLLPLSPATTKQYETFFSKMKN
jgi:putative spermidine/putrescine transport system substrate-binding protein